jgi:membrane-associated phospholipid phosphatase
LIPKLSCLGIWTAFGLILYVNGMLKLVYEEPRPFWVSPDITSNECLKEFGNPSGHCFIASFFFLTIYLHKYYEVGHKVNIRTIFCTAYIIKMAFTAFLLIGLIFLAISRLYLGAHTYN